MPLYHFHFHSNLIFKHLAGYKDTFLALCELINNSIQANANEVDIGVQLGDMDQFASSPWFIRVTDNGTGVTKGEFEAKILTVAHDIKPGGRGVGRFAALQLGSTVQISTLGRSKTDGKAHRTVFNLNADDIIKAATSLNKHPLDVIHEEAADDATSYYEVVIRDFYSTSVTKKEKRKKLHRSVYPALLPDALFEQYAEYIFNQRVTFRINGVTIDPDNYMLGEPESRAAAYTDQFGNSHPATFEFIKVNVKDAASSKVFAKLPNAGMHISVPLFRYYADIPSEETWFVYIDSPYFEEFTDYFRNVQTIGMDGRIPHLREFIRSHVDGFFSEKYAKYKGFVEVLKADEYYPFKERAVSSETKRVVFNQLAYHLETEHKLVSEGNRLRKVIYPLLDKAISHGELEVVLEKVVGLDKSAVNRFRDLLDRAELDKVISFAEEVALKTHILDLLNHIVYGEPAKRVKERKELHKIVEKHLWLFGEVYQQATTRLFSDKNLENNLTELRKETFGKKIPAKELDVIALKEKSLKSITDLFFYSERPMDDGSREIVVVELKAPKVRLGTAEMSQLDEYFFQIERRGKFSEQYRYKLILISSEINERARSKLLGDPKSPTLYRTSSTGKQIEAHVCTWADLIAINRQKLSYMSNMLQTKDLDIKGLVESEFAEIEGLKGTLQLVSNGSAAGSRLM